MDSPSPSPVSSPAHKKRKQMVRFTAELEYELIVETHARNPFSEEYGKRTNAWAEVAAKMSADLDGRRCRDKCNQLLDAFEAAQKNSERRSGVEEDYTERDQYLAELLEMRESEMIRQNERKQEKDQRSRDEEIVAGLRNAAMTGLATQNKGTNSANQQQLIQYLESRDRKAQEIEVRKVDNETKRLELEERRLHLDEQRFEVDREERLAFIDVLKAAMASVSHLRVPTE